MENGNIRKISVVIPIRNEEGNIAKLHSGLCEYFNTSSFEFEILYVNDGSVDKSAEIIKSICKIDSNTRLISFFHPFGQDAALAAGFKEAVGDVVIAIDGDLQDDPRDISLFLEKINEKYDIISGWRKFRSRRNLARNSVSFLGNRLAWLYFGISMHDFNSTFKAYTKEAIGKLYFFKGFHRCVPVLALISGLRITEVVVSNRARRSGKSKYRVFCNKRILETLRAALLLKFAILFLNKQVERIIPPLYYEIEERFPL